jgi:hypothetical protein
MICKTQTCPNCGYVSEIKQRRNTPIPAYKLCFNCEAEAENAMIVREQRWTSQLSDEIFYCAADPREFHGGLEVGDKLTGQELIGMLRKEELSIGARFWDPSFKRYEVVPAEPDGIDLILLEE